MARFPIARSFAGCLAVLIAVSLLTGPGITGAAAGSPHDVRGAWKIDLRTASFTYRFVIREQTPDGAFTGVKKGRTTDYKPRAFRVDISGTVRGDRLTMRFRNEATRWINEFRGTLELRGTTLTARGTYSDTEGRRGTFTGILVKPAKPQGSAEGGTRPSAMLLLCNRDMTMGGDPAMLRCNALVTDASAQPGSRPPTGTIEWDSGAGRLAADTCLLVPRGGVSSCAVTLTGTAAELPIGTELPVTASYPGDALFAPSDASHQLFGAARGYTASDQYGPACSPATSRKPVVGCGDPVNPATGNLGMTIEDMSIPGRGPSLAVIRSYNAQAAPTAEPGAMAPGWSHGFSARIALGSGDRATVHLGTGATIPFKRKGRAFSGPAWVTAALERGPGRTFVLTFADQQRLTFDRVGRLIALSDRRAEPITVAYTDAGLLASATDASGRQLTFGHDSEGRITSAIDPAGRSVTYAYDAAGDLVTVTDVGGGVSRYAYDAEHRLVSAADATGSAITTHYDGQGRVLEQVDARGGSIAFSYLGSYPSQVTVVTDAEGARSAYEYTGGVLVSVTEDIDGPAPATTTWHYDAQLAVVGTVDPRGASWQTPRNEAGDILAATDPLGRTTTFSWSPEHDLLSTVSPLGSETRIEYDDHGSPVRIVRAAGRPEETAITLGRADPQHPGDITDITDAAGGVTTLGRDAHGAVVSRTDALGDTSRVSRDVLGRVTGMTDALGATTAITLDAHGDAQEMTDPLGGVSTFVRDPTQRLVSSQDPLGAVMTLQRDATGRPTSVTLPDGTTLATEHDGRGDGGTQTDGLGAVSSFVRDGQRRPTTWTDAAGNAWRMAWDPAGDLVSAIDPLGQETRYTWDVAGQLTTIDHPDGTPDVSFTWDADGRRATMTDGSGTTGYAWDLRGNLISVTDGRGQTVATAYDARGVLTSITYPDGRVVERDHDALGRLVALRDGLGHTSRFGWDAAGRLVRIETGDGSITDRVHDARGALVSVRTRAAGSDVPFLALTYARDAAGRVTSITDDLVPDQEQRVTRDERGQVTGLGEDVMALDAAGNLTRLRGDTLSYDGVGRLVSATGPEGQTTYSADAAGRRVAVGAAGGAQVAYTWDAASRLVEAGGSRYAYDGDGLRTLAETSDGAAAFTWSRAGDSPMLLGDGTSWFVYGPGGMPLEEIRGDGTVRWLHVDQTGSVRAVTDESGGVVATSAWDAYGKLERQTGEDGQPRLGFHGRYTDRDTGFQFLPARVYDPATARFLSIDPQVVTTRQPYAFAAGDPLTYSDPIGAAPVPVADRPFRSAFVEELFEALGFPQVLGFPDLSDQDRAMNPLDVLEAYQDATLVPMYCPDPDAGGSPGMLGHPALKTVLNLLPNWSKADSDEFRERWNAMFEER